MTAVEDLGRRARAAGRRRKHERHAAAMLPAWSQPADEPPFTDQELAAAIDMLLPEHREVLVARVWGGLGFEDIAELIGAAAYAKLTAFHETFTARPSMQATALRAG